MNGHIQVEYKGFLIRYIEFSNTWENIGTGRGYESLAKVKEAVDRAVRITEKMEPIPCIHRKRGGVDGCDYEETQIMAYDSPEIVWIKKIGEKGRGTKVSCLHGNEIFANTPENRDAIKRIVELSGLYDAIREQIEGIEELLVPLNVQAHYEKMLEKVKVTTK